LCATKSPGAILDSAKRWARADRLERSATSGAPALDGPEGARPTTGRVTAEAHDGPSNGRGPGWAEQQGRLTAFDLAGQGRPGPLTYLLSDDAWIGRGDAVWDRRGGAGRARCDRRRPGGRRECAARRRSQREHCPRAPRHPALGAGRPRSPRQWLRRRAMPRAKGIGAWSRHKPPRSASLEGGSRLRGAATSGHEGFDQRADGLGELALEHQGRKRALEGEPHAELDAASVGAYGREQPLALERLEGTAHQVHQNPLVGLELVAGSELAVQRPLFDADRRHDLALGPGLHARVGAPRQEARVALDVVDEREQAARRLGDERRALDLSHRR